MHTNQGLERVVGPDVVGDTMNAILAQINHLHAVRTCIGYDRHCAMRFSQRTDSAHIFTAFDY